MMLQGLTFLFSVGNRFSCFVLLKKYASLFIFFNYQSKFFLVLFVLGSLSAGDVWMPLDLDHSTAEEG